MLDQGVLCIHHDHCSGLVAYREAGLDIRIVERDSVLGGSWHYTKEIHLDAPASTAATHTVSLGIRIEKRNRHQRAS
jgi:hypothetical protein